MPNRSSRALLTLALVASPLVVSPPADAQTQHFFSPAKVVKQGTSTTPIAGSGRVQLKVFVNPNGSVKSVDVEKSTNPGDNAAAVEIAKSSTYKPAATDAKPVGSFYTFVLTFNGNAVSSSEAAGGGATAGGGGTAGLARATALVRANKYADAKTELQAYLTTHPDDKSAEALLGVAESYLNDPAGSAAAFDKAGTVPPLYTAVAVKAYNDAASAAIGSKRFDEAVAYTTRSLAVQPSPNAYYLQGAALMSLGQYDKAVASLESAKAVAAGKSDASSINAIDAQLAQAYLLAGQQQKGIALATDVKRRDPAMDARMDDAVAAAYNLQAQGAMKAGNTTQAISALEAGAAASPRNAGPLYVTAARLLAQNAKSKDDWKRVKVEADKAVAAAPNDANALYVQGIAIGSSGDLNGAKAVLLKAKANAAGDAQLSAQIDQQLDQLAKAGAK